MSAGKQPKAIIIVRHGIRLDQADRNWRENAKFPYDPPLSYGGWIQCQTLGARIGKELQTLNGFTSNPLAGDVGDGTKSRPRKKRRIVIHSSPYKRCIQTSVAIAAGLKYPDAEKLRPLPGPYQRASYSGPSTSSEPPRGLGIALTAESGNIRPTIRPPFNDDRVDVKVDPWLGEWLSTGYFEDSTPPPPGNEIIGRARDTLTIPVEEIRGADLAAFLEVAETPTEDDADKENVVADSTEKSGLRAMAAAGHSLPHRTRTTSFGTAWTSNTRSLYKEKMRSRPRATTYSPPLPQYSLAPQDPIPAGYVAHAREACVNPSLEWDSIAMNWGNGGSYPEEWSEMHVRFRHGLQKLLAYYQDLDNLPRPEKEFDEDEVEEDLVLVLVTHQAGANALIRLMTGAPALHDIGVASLTLAVKRPVLRRPPSLSNTNHSPLGYDRDSRKNSRRGSMDLGLADEFEMRIIASTEHLRYGSNPLGLNSPRLGQSPAMTGRRMVGAESLEGFSIGDPLAKRSNSSNNIITRSSSQRNRTTDINSNSAANSGLWGSPAIPATVSKAIEENFEDLPPMSPKSRPSTPSAVENIPETTLSSPTRSRSNTVQSTGLWGSNNTSFGNLQVRPAPSEGSANRARSPAKRRWTAVSNSP